MLFNSFEFLLFFPLVLFCYYVLHRRFQNAFLLVASYVFYGFWDWRFLSLLWISTVVDFFVGNSLHFTENKQKRKVLLLISVVVNLSLLGFFKYFNFFVESAANFLELFNLSPSVPLLKLILPVGISFYTFQTMTYTIDIYRRKIKPTVNFIDFALFVAYFPQLVAGPIERASRLLPQIQKKRTVSDKYISMGVMLILIGLVKKVVIADNVAVYVDYAFANQQLLDSGALLKGLYLFSVQIYCDFSGYTDIARGVSYLFGIELMVNFDQPYLSQSVTEFWRRWHISLSSWLRDYLYIPLGGNRKGRLNTYRNLFITMLLGGLWHGAYWTFIVWGGLHGLYLSVEKITLHTKKKFKIPELPKRLQDLFLMFVRIFVVFHLVCLTWIFFRAPDFQTAWEYLTGILAFSGLSNIGIIPFAAIAAIMVFDVPQYISGNHVIFFRLPKPARLLGYAVLLVSIVTLGMTNETPFIYFQF